MKKIFTLSIAFAGAASVFASTPDVVTAPESVAEGFAAVAVDNAPAVAVKEASVAAEVNAMSAVKSQSATVMGLPAASAVNMYYTGPNGGFYGYTYLDAPSGSTTYFNDGALAPAYVNTIFNNRSYYVEDGKYLRVKDGDYNFAWSVYAEENDVDAFDLSYMSYPFDYAEYSWHAPTLKLGSVEYSKPLVWNGAESQLTYKVGGTLFDEELFESRKEKNPTYSNFRYMAHTYNQTDPLYYGSYATNVFAYGSTIVQGATATAAALNSWNGLSDASGVSNITEIEGFYQDFQCAAPMAISYAYVNVQANYKAGAKLKFDFYTLENGEQKDLINTYVYDFEGSYTVAGRLTGKEVKIPFTSKDASGFNIDYMIVDKDFRMVVSGIEDPNFNMVRLLVVGMSQVGNGLNPNNGGENVALYSGANLGAIVNGSKEGVVGSYAVQNRYYNFGEDEDEQGNPLGTWSAFTPVSFKVGFDMEYPYLQATAAALNGASALESVELQNEYTAEVKSASQRAVYQVMCPGSLDDILVETVEGDEIPEWLTVDYNKTMIKPDPRYADATPNYFALVFALTDGAQAGGCEVKVSYKGMSNIFKINPDLSGIEGVVDNGVETVASEYYDLQGRKLYNEPANGLFIRKDIKADGSVKSVKVVK